MSTHHPRLRAVVRPPGRLPARTPDRNHRGGGKPRPSPPNCASSTPTARRSPTRRSTPAPITIKTDPKAECFGPGTGGSGDKVELAGATALGLVADGGLALPIAEAALGHRLVRLRSRPLRHRQGRSLPTTGFWYLKHNHVASSDRRRSDARQEGRRRPLVPDRGLQRPDPRLSSCSRRRPGSSAASRSRSRSSRVRRRRQADAGRRRRGRPGPTSRPTPRARRRSRPTGDDHSVCRRRARDRFRRTPR